MKLTSGRGRALWCVGLALLFFLLGSAAGAEPWLCPDCPDQVVDRPAGSKELVCPACGRTYTVDQLAPLVAYVDSRTRDTEIPWVVQSDSCDIFRLDGLQAFDGKGGVVWVPWTLVEWYIPRMRLLKLTSGRELMTDYPKGDVTCVSPPKFIFEVADSVSFPGQNAQLRKQRQEETMAELFIVAMTPEARDSARVRFINEVESGKQPRLPRTQPQLYRAAQVPVPPQAAKEGWKGETLIEVKVHEHTGLLVERLLQSSGHPELDQAALNAIRYSSFFPGGEMGVPVPAWLDVRVVFDGAKGRMEAVKAPHAFWRDYY